MTDELPPGWAVRQLREIAEIKGGLAKGKSRPDGTQTRSVPYLRVANVQRGRLDLREVSLIDASEREIAQLRLEKGDVLLNEGGDRDKLGRGWIWDGEIPECIHQNHVFRARLLPGISPKYVSWYANTVGASFFLLEGAQTTNLASISISKLGSLPVHVPPLKEQRRIVAKLEDLLARSKRANESLAAIPPLLEKLRQSVLSAAMRGDLTAEWRAKNPGIEPAGEMLRRTRTERQKKWEESEFARLSAKGQPPRDDRWKAKYAGPAPIDESGLPALPAGWCWSSAEEIVEDGAEIVYGIVQPGPEMPGGVPYVRGLDIQEGRILIHQLKRTHPDIAARYARASLRSGDVLLGIIRATKVAVVPKALSGANITQGTARLRPGPAITTNCLAAWLDGPWAQAWLHDHYRGIDMPGLNLQDVRRLPVPVAPLGEQLLISEVVEKCQRRLLAFRTAHAQLVARSETLAPTVLSKAFRGDLVDQDANDEPAETTLERLAAAQVAHQVLEAPKRGSRRRS